jgi:hypothetical protein
MMGTFALMAALATLPSCAVVCGPEPPPRNLSSTTLPHVERERLRWESCMGYLPNPAALVARVRPTRPGDRAIGKVADQLRSRLGCNGPLKFHLDHSMGAGQIACMAAGMRRGRMR